MKGMPDGADRTRPRGFSLVELVVALTVFAVGVLGLAGAAAFAQRSFTAADAVERATRAAATVLDSLLREPRIEDGERAASGTVTRWTVTADSVTRVITAEVEVPHGDRTLSLEFRAAGPVP